MLTRKINVQQDNTISFGNATLNTQSFELSAPSGSYRLANKEYQTMLLFMRNPHKADVHRSGFPGGRRLKVLYR